jgi:hypothetical protein
MTLKFLFCHQKAKKWHYRVKSWVIFNKGQFTHICQLNVSYGQDSVSGIIRIKKIWKKCFRLTLSNREGLNINKFDIVACRTHSRCFGIMGGHGNLIW